MSTSTSVSPENKIRQLIGGIRNLPTPPIVFEQIQKVINNPQTSVADVASILSEDPAMSVKILKLTNSAFYGLQREVDSVRHAVMIIGLEAVKNLVLSASVLNMFKANDSNREFHEMFWRHSLSVAFASRVIARKFKAGKVFNSDPAFSAGLIHDIGKMIICCYLPDEHQKKTEYLEQNQEADECDAETAILGFDHALVGHELIVTWKLPQRMADAVAYHHRPSETNESEDMAYLVNLADYLAHISTLADRSESMRYRLPEEVAGYFGMNDGDIDDFKATLMEEYSKAETFMRIAGIA